MPGKSKKIIQYDKRFGAIAIEKGFITLDELIEALTIQVKEEIEHGEHKLIGTILFDKDILTADQVQEVVNVVLKRDD